MTKRKEPATILSPQKGMQGRQYPGIKGKVVDFADHAFEEGLLYIRVRFTDLNEAARAADAYA